MMINVTKTKPLMPVSCLTSIGGSSVAGISPAETIGFSETAGETVSAAAAGVSAEAGVVAEFTAGA